MEIFCHCSISHPLNSVDMELDTWSSMNLKIKITLQGISNDCHIYFINKQSGG
jgi:hypothetical protein